MTSQRAWLADLLAITLNLVFRTDVTPQTTARAVGRLRRIRLRFGSPIKVAVRNTGLGTRMARYPWCRWMTTAYRPS